MQKIADIGRAHGIDYEHMAHRPKLLILDEATSGLDPVVCDEVLDLFLEFIQDEENSIFFSSHITSDIEKVADYVILIHQGKIIFEEEKDVLMYNYGVAKCGKESFNLISPEDYVVCKSTNVSMECLVRDKEDFSRKYKDIIVDNATLEDILLFYVKGGIPCSVMLAMTVGMQNIMCCLIATAIPLRSIAKMNIVESIENVE